MIAKVVNRTVEQEAVLASRDHRTLFTEQQQTGTDKNKKNYENKVVLKKAGCAQIYKHWLPYLLA